MLKTRIVSALVLAILLGSAIVFLPTEALSAVLAVLFLVGAYEWATLTGQRQTAFRKGGYVGIVALIILSLVFLPLGQTLSTVVKLAAFMWLLITVALALYQRSEEGGQPRWQGLLALAGCVLLPAAWLSMTLIHAEDFRLLVFVFVLAASADSFAYFAGKRFGKNKLAPELSPGKTREGFLGGLVGVMMVSLVYVAYAHMPIELAVPFVLLCLVCGVVSVVGDLFESLMKREAGLKDSGRLIPGHGGILDRFDSHIAVAPVFWLGWQWING